MDDTIIIGQVKTPAGMLGVARSPRGVGCLALPGEPLALCAAWARRWMPGARVVHDTRGLDDVAEQLAAYFAGDLREFSLPLDLCGTPFQLLAWRALLEIPYGEVRTYAQHAAAIGRPRAVRAVGAANGANPIAIILPCHRLIGSDGALVGYGGGLALKRRLLELEGAPVS